jgi:hypothetical protein
MASVSRDADQFEIVLGLQSKPEVDLYRRAEEHLGVTGMLCVLWDANQQPTSGQAASDTDLVGRYQIPIERFAEDIIAMWRTSM